MLYALWQASQQASQPAASLSIARRDLRASQDIKRRLSSSNMLPGLLVSKGKITCRLLYKGFMKRRAPSRWQALGMSSR